jgi:hypothetical protein
VIPRIPPMVSIVAAVCAVLVVPYYVMTGSGEWASAMVALAGLNAMCAWS